MNARPGGAPIEPPSTIGMLGGGQLGRYALVAATLMGYRTVVLDPDPNAPAGVVADEHLVAAYDDADALDRLTASCAVVTTEFENPPAAALDRLATAIPVAPSPAAVRIAQDRIAEKSFLSGHGFPVGAHGVLTARDDATRDGRDDPHGLEDALLANGAVIKTARLGYDGKGQRRVHDRDGLAAAWDELGTVDCVVESLLDLRTEVSVLVGRTADGATATWPVAENAHRDGILDVSIVPARIPDALAADAVDLATRIAEALDYVGVLAVEMFVVADEHGDDRLLVNELAPRPHNSGHWTLDASVTSQYEQQIRTVCGVGLGDTTMTCGAVAMVNLLGDVWDGGEPRWRRALDDPTAKLHLYGKTEARPGRKMGHLTVLGDDADDVRRRAVDLRDALRVPPT